MLPARMISDCTSFMETNYMLYYTSKQAPAGQGFGGACERWPTDPVSVCTSFEVRGSERDAEQLHKSYLVSFYMNYRTNTNEFFNMHVDRGYFLNRVIWKQGQGEGEPSNQCEVIFWEVLLL